MTIIQKQDCPDISIVLDNIAEITKGDCIRTCADTYYGWHTINFITTAGKFIQWDYGKSEEGQKIRDEQYQLITKNK